MTDQLPPQHPDAARRALALSLGLMPGLPLLASGPAAAQSAPPAPASQSGVFRHPGLLMTDADFVRIRAHIKAGEQPWTGWWNKLCADPIVSLDAKPNPVAGVYRADSSKFAMYRDIYRAWCLALRWRLSDDTRYADKAVETMDAWANTLKVVATKPPGSTAPEDWSLVLMGGMQGHQWAQAGEIMRSYAGWPPANLKRFQDMLLNVFVPSFSWFLSEPRIGAHANWELASFVGAMAIGVFCDQPDLYRLAYDGYAGNNRGKLRAFGNGSILHSVYFMHPGHFGQWEESGRDQGHATLGMSLGGDLLEMAWNQGDDLYGLYNNRFLAAAEYVARSNLLDENGKTYPMPFAREHDPSQPRTSLWTQVNQSFGSGRNAWEPIYNHYVNRMGLAAPNVTRMVAKCEPNYWSGNGDDMVFPTLTHRRAAYAGPLQPASGLTAHIRGDSAVLSWWGSVGATSYVVKRGPKAGGPFTYLATVAASEPLTHADKPPKGIWFYQVTALGSASASAASNVVRLAVPGEPRFGMPLNGRNGTDLLGVVVQPTGSYLGVRGKLLDGATWGEGRLGDKAIAFDGKKAGLELPPAIFSGLEDFSLSLWAYANSLHWDTCMFFAGTDAFSYMWLAPQSGRGGLRFVIAGATHNDAQGMEAPSAMPTRRWVHVAVTLKAGTGRLYLDGTEVAKSDDILLSPRQVGDQVAFLGRNWAHPSFNGRIQAVRVDAGALSPAEVAALAK